jgi:hypothetical protein
MIRFNLVTAAAILSAAIATPVSAQQAVQEPGAQAFYQSLGVGSYSTAAANALAFGDNAGKRHLRASSELPTYEANGLPISRVQAGLLGGANVREQSAATQTASPHQLRVLTPRPKLKTATAAPARTGVATY